MGARQELEVFEPGTTRDRWRHEAASHAEELSKSREPVPMMCDSRKVLLRSRGPGARFAPSTCPVYRLTKFTSQFSCSVDCTFLIPLPCATGSWLVDVAKKLKVVVDVLPFFGRAQLAVDTKTGERLASRWFLQEEGSTRWTGRKSELVGFAQSALIVFGSKCVVHARPKLSSPRWLGPNLLQRPS